MCYNNIVYTKDRKSATVTAKCRKHDSITTLEYNWNDQGFDTKDSFEIQKYYSNDKPVSLVVKAIDGDKNEFTITMDPTNFLW
jgi:hypothetical protein